MYLCIAHMELSSHHTINISRSVAISINVASLKSSSFISPPVPPFGLLSLSCSGPLLKTTPKRSTNRIHEWRTRWQHQLMDTLLGLQIVSAWKWWPGEHFFAQNCYTCSLQRSSNIIQISNMENRSFESTSSTDSEIFVLVCFSVPESVVSGWIFAEPWTRIIPWLRSLNPTLWQ